MLTEQQTLTSAHLFCGGGGDTDGAVRAGFEPLWGIESDRYAAAVFRQRFPEDYLVSSQSPEEAWSLASSCSARRTGIRPRRLKDGKAALIPTSYRRQRPLSATEFERLIGWPVCSTEKGITASGKEISISKTQRQKMLGNGIVPQEIEDRCNKLTDFLALSSQSFQPAQQSTEEDWHISLDSQKPGLQQYPEYCNGKSG